MSIELKRHHNARIKKNRQHYWGYKDEVLDERRLGIVSKTPHPCTCYMCGNPRHFHDELTIQEQKFKQEPIED